MEFPSPQDAARTQERERQQQQTLQQQRQDVRQQQSAAEMQQQEQRQQAAQQAEQQRQDQHKADDRKQAGVALAEQQKKRQAQERNRAEALKRQPRDTGPSQPAQQAGQGMPMDMKPGGDLQRAGALEQVKEVQRAGERQVLSAQEKFDGNMKQWAVANDRAAEKIDVRDKEKNAQIENAAWEAGSLEHIEGRYAEMVEAPHVEHETARETSAEMGKKIFAAEREALRDHDQLGANPAIVSQLKAHEQVREQAQVKDAVKPEQRVGSKDAAQLVDCCARLGISTKDTPGKPDPANLPSQKEVAQALDTAEKIHANPKVIDQLREAEKVATPEKVKEKEVEKPMDRGFER